MNEIDRARSIIRRIFDETSCPVIVGYSGGKDSTLLLQLVAEATTKKERGRLIVSTELIEYDADEKKRYIREVKAMIENFGVRFTEVKNENAKQGFFSNLIGRGYEAPKMSIRYCTRSLKMTPNSRFVRQIAQNGGVRSFNRKKKKRIEQKASAT